MIIYGTLASPTSASSGSSGNASGGSGSGTSEGGKGGSSLLASPTSVLYSTDPFKSNFNPGDKHRASLFKTTIEPLPEKDRYTLSQDKAKKLLLHIKSKEATYFWGTIVTKIPQAYPVDPKTCKSLLISLNKVSMNSVKRAVAKCWAKRNTQSTTADFDNHILQYPHLTVSSTDPGNVPGDDAVFYERTCRVMIARIIRGMLKDASLATLNLNRKNWTWIDGDDEHEDGPRMLKYLFLEVNLSTVISILKYKQLIEEAKLSAYGNCVNTMLSKMQESYDKILENDCTYDDYLRHIFRALFTSSNKRFVLSCMISILRILTL